MPLRSGSVGCARSRCARLMLHNICMLSRLVMIIAVALPLVAAPMTTLKIEVRDLNDKPVDRAAVIVKFLQGHSLVKLGRKMPKQWELRTNQEGIAKLLPIPQGKIQVQVIAKKYQTFGQVFDVTETEKTIEVKLNPPQPQYSAHQ